ncbi:MAG: hypothetical protein KAT66_05370 [Candidatus Lokiarchaeota archaeon]|nr:hypothetical protein [Candidatus Lokiarchaeota archaeon]
MFGVAGGELVSMLISLVVFPRLYEQMDMPKKLIKVVMINILVVSIVASVILVCVGVILLIKFREE